MPQRSKVVLLPDEILNELNDRLIAGRFSDYRALAQWLKDKGFEISKSSLHEYGKSFEEKLATLKLSTDQARAVVDAAPDDEGAMNEALMRLIQEKLFKILMEINIDPSRINIASLARSVAELARANVALKKYREQVRDQKRAAAASVEKIAKKGGLSASMVTQIRSQILGIGGAAAEGATG